MTWLKNALDWITANPDTIMNWAVSASAAFLAAAKIYSIFKSVFSKIKSNEITVDNDTALQAFKAEILQEVKEMTDKYMQNFDDKMAVAVETIQTRQDQIETERQKQIEEQTLKVNEKIQLLKKIKSEDSDNEKSSV